MWKAGCLTAVAGVLLTVGSIVFFGTAIKKVVSSREVAGERIEAGLWFESEDVRVDPSGQVRIEIEAKIQLSADILAAADASASIEQLSASVSYEVRDETGYVLYHESGAATGSTVVPAASSPHRESFDSVALCRFEGARFDAPKQGAIRVAVEIPEVDEGGNEILSGRLVVLDQLPRGASRWAWGGVFSMLVGPLVTFIGFVVFVIGLLTRKRRTDSAIPPVP